MKIYMHILLCMILYWTFFNQNMFQLLFFHIIIVYKVFHLADNTCCCMLREIFKMLLENFCTQFLLWIDVFMPHNIIIKNCKSVNTCTSIIGFMDFDCLYNIFMQFLLDGSVTKYKLLIKCWQMKSMI